MPPAEAKDVRKLTRSVQKLERSIADLKVFLRTKDLPWKRQVKIRIDRLLRAVGPGGPPPDVTPAPPSPPR